MKALSNKNSVNGWTFTTGFSAENIATELRGYAASLTQKLEQAYADYVLVENTLLRHASSSNATFMLSPDDKKVYTRPTLGRLARQLSRQISLLRESIERIENKLCAICPDTGKYIAKERLLSVHRNESYSTPYGKRPSN